MVVEVEEVVDVVENEISSLLLCLSKTAEYRGSRRFVDSIGSIRNPSVPPRGRLNSSRGIAEFDCWLRFVAGASPPQRRFAADR